MKQTTYIDDLERDVLKWAFERDLLNSDDGGGKQLLKMFEEAGELSRAHLKDDINATVDGIGDVLVTLIIFANINGLNLYQCLNHAYSEIKDRQGKTINGTFIKEA